MIIKFPTAAESAAAERRNARALASALLREMKSLRHARKAYDVFYADHFCSQCELLISECVCYTTKPAEKDRRQECIAFFVSFLAMLAAAAIVAALFSWRR